MGNGNKEQLLDRYAQLGVSPTTWLLLVNLGDALPLIARELTRSGRSLGDAELLALATELQEELHDAWRRPAARIINRFLEASSERTGSDGEAAG